MRTTARQIFYVFVGIGISLLMAGCLVSRAELRAQTDGKNMQTQLQALQQSRAGSEAQQQEILSRLLSMNGRIEVLENKIALADKDKFESEKNLEEQKKAELERLKAYAEELEKLNSQMQALTAAVDKLQNSRTTAAAPSDKVKGGKDFQSGESLFENKKWREAILKYEAYRTQYPKGRNFAEATYKIGVCFQELGKKNEAKLFYEEVASQFKDSRMAKKAAYRLKNIK